MLAPTPTAVPTTAQQPIVTSTTAIDTKPDQKSATTATGLTETKLSTAYPAVGINFAAMKEPHQTGVTSDHYAAILMSASISLKQLISTMAYKAYQSKANKEAADYCWSVVSVLLPAELKKLDIYSSVIDNDSPYLTSFIHAKDEAEIRSVFWYAMHSQRYEIALKVLTLIIQFKTAGTTNDFFYKEISIKQLATDKQGIWSTPALLGIKGMGTDQAKIVSVYLERIKIDINYDPPILIFFLPFVLSQIKDGQYQNEPFELFQFILVSAYWFHKLSNEDRLCVKNLYKPALDKLLQNISTSYFSFGLAIRLVGRASELQKQNITFLTQQECYEYSIRLLIEFARKIESSVDNADKKIIRDVFHRLDHTSSVWEKAMKALADQQQWDQLISLIKHCAICSSTFTLSLIVRKFLFQSKNERLFGNKIAELKQLISDNLKIFYPDFDALKKDILKFSTADIAVAQELFIWCGHLIPENEIPFLVKSLFENAAKAKPIVKISWDFTKEMDAHFRAEHTDPKIIECLRKLEVCVVEYLIKEETDIKILKEIFFADEKPSGDAKEEAGLVLLRNRQQSSNAVVNLVKGTTSFLSRHTIDGKEYSGSWCQLRIKAQQRIKELQPSPSLSVTVTAAAPPLPTPSSKPREFDGAVELHDIKSGVAAVANVSGVTAAEFGAKHTLS